MGSPFLGVSPEQWLASNSLAFAFRDAFPVGGGHALVVPRRLVATWWDATAEERAAIWSIVDEVNRRIDAELAPHGCNVGFNTGDAARQTAPHLQVHVIPQYRGDVADPRGGVRWVVPPRANYLESAAAAERGIRLLSGGDGTVTPPDLRRDRLLPVGGADRARRFPGSAAARRKESSRTSVLERPSTPRGIRRSTSRGVSCRRRLTIS
jgi:diadenosine tetraphosphate (Ap4A) HIT family hydrolase